MSKDPTNKRNKSLFPEQDLEAEDDDSWQVSYLDIITILLGFLIILLSFSTLKDLETFSVSDLFESENQSEFITTPIDEIIKELEALLAPEILAGRLTIYRELNDAKIEFKSDDLYSSGSAILKDDSKIILNRVLDAFKLIKYNDFEIDVEGHTDNVPINNSSFASNWELSTARASNIVKHFIEMGITEKRLKASGYADSRPLVEFDMEGNPVPADKSRNRRVVLRLYYTSPSQFIANSSIIDSSSTADTSTSITDNLEIDSMLVDAETESPTNIDEIEETDPTTADPVIPNTEITKEEIAEVQTPPSTEEETPASQTESQPKKPVKRPDPIVKPNEDGCSYTIQINEFESFANALNAANNAERNSRLSFDIVYNNYLFSVRSQSFTSLKSAIQNFNRLPNSIKSIQNAGVINQCYSQPHQFPDKLTYLVQLGFFQNEQNAVSFQNSISEQLNISSVIEKLSIQAFNVYSGPYSTRSEAETFLNSIKNNDNLEGAFIKYDPLSISDYNYNYQIVVGSYVSQTRAYQVAENIESVLGRSVDVESRSDGNFYIIAPSFGTQNQTLQAIETLKSRIQNITPILFLDEDS